MDGLEISMEMGMVVRPRKLFNSPTTITITILQEYNPKLTFPNHVRFRYDVETVHPDPDDDFILDKQVTEDDKAEALKLKNEANQAFAGRSLYHSMPFHPGVLNKLVR
jgi:hypothetical protein